MFKYCEAGRFRKICELMLKIRYRILVYSGELTEQTEVNREAKPEWTIFYATTGYVADANAAVKLE